MYVPDFYEAFSFSGIQFAIIWKSIKYKSLAKISNKTEKSYHVSICSQTSQKYKRDCWTKINEWKLKNAHLCLTRIYNTALKEPRNEPATFSKGIGSSSLNEKLKAALRSNQSQIKIKEPVISFVHFWEWYSNARSQKTELSKRNPENWFPMVLTILRIR